VKIMGIYSIYSRFYDSFFGSIFHPGRQITNELMDVQPGEKILEVGIGTGISLPLYPKEAEVVGIDISQNMIKQAEEKKQRLDLSNVRLCIMDASKMAFKDDYFDKVIAAHSITVIPEPVKTLREMKRVCKRNAEFFFLNYTGSNNKLIAIFEKAISPIRNKLGLGKAVDLEELLYSTDFKIVFRKGVNILKWCQIIKSKNICL
jgi:phosphatidylethanolamine/phosphatidyl-N-methylethanolamine N-methyltransferase